MLLACSVACWAAHDPANHRFYSPNLRGDRPPELYGVACLFCRSLGRKRSSKPPDSVCKISRGIPPRALLLCLLARSLAGPRTTLQITRFCSQNLPWDPTPQSFMVLFAKISRGTSFIVLLACSLGHLLGRDRPCKPPASTRTTSRGTAPQSFIVLLARLSACWVADDPPKHQLRFAKPAGGPPPRALWFFLLARSLAAPRTTLPKATGHSCQENLAVEPSPSAGIMRHRAVRVYFYFHFVFVMLNLLCLILCFIVYMCYSSLLSSLFTDPPRHEVLRLP